VNCAPGKRSHAGREQHAPGPGIRLVDSTICAAQVALWNGAATSDMIFPILERMDEAGFAAIDILDPDLARLAVERGDNPFHLLRAAASRLRRTPVNVWISARYLLGATTLTRDLLELGISHLARCGVRRVTCFDALNDVGAINRGVELCHRSGIEASAALVHAASRHHDEGYYRDHARGLACGPVSSIAVVDLAGSLTPTTTRALVAAVHGAVGSIPIEFRSHCRSGVAEMGYFEAVACGADVLHTSIEALAGGWSLPPASYFSEHFSRRELPLTINASALAETDEYFAALADAHGLPCGRHELPDPSAERFQIPVALLRRCETAAAAHGIAIETLLSACVEVQGDLGSPTLAHPVGALVLSQARLNLSGGEPYAALTPEVAGYARGDYGAPPGRVNTRLLERAARIPPPSTLSQCRSDISEERRVLSALFPEHDLASFTRAVPEPVHGGSPQQYLKEQLERHPTVQAIRVRKGEFVLELNRVATPTPREAP
jgi:oxaloacetate decarboxylase alpha subunit